MGNTVSERTDGYDIVVDIKQISHVSAQNGGWPIYISSAIHKKVNGTSSMDQKSALKQLELDQNFAVVAVLGLFNRGKSHILNQLAGQFSSSSSSFPIIRSLRMIDIDLGSW